MMDDMDMENEARGQSLHGLMKNMDQAEAGRITKDGKPILTIQISLGEPETPQEDQNEPAGEPGQKPGYDDSADSFPGGPNGPAESPIMALIRKKKEEQRAGA